MMTSTTAVDRRPRFPLLKKSAAILFWIAVWEIVSLCVGQELLVPSPAQVLVRLLQLLRETDFWLISAASLLRIMAGYLAAVVAAVFLAVLTSASSFLHALVSPLLGIIKAARQPDSAVRGFSDGAANYLGQCQRGNSQYGPTAIGNGPNVPFRPMENGLAHLCAKHSALFHGGMYHRPWARLEGGRGGRGARHAAQFNWIAAI